MITLWNIFVDQKTKIFSSLRFSFREQYFFSSKISDYKTGSTPSHHAAYFGFTEILEELWKYHAELQVEDNEGGTPLHNAVYNAHKDCIFLLVNLGADVNKADKLGYTPLRISCYKGNTYVR